VQYVYAKGFIFITRVVFVSTEENDYGHENETGRRNQFEE